MFSFGRKLIKVTFREQGTRTIISAVRMPSERLPDSFGPGTELKMAGANYLVVAAQPDTKAKALDSGQVEVLVRRRDAPAG